MYMNIDRDIKTIAVATPYDDEISELNDQLNNTYIHYGQQGKSYKNKQLKQDANQEGVVEGGGIALLRTIAKLDNEDTTDAWERERNTSHKIKVLHPRKHWVTV